MEKLGKVDTHVHTKYSGFAKYSLAQFPDSVSEPNMIVNKAIRKKIDILCITDHNSIEGALKVQNCAKGLDIEIIIGEEVLTAEGEMIGLFLQERIEPELSAQETAELIHDQGGVAIAPHPFSPHCRCLGHKVRHLDVDGIEVFNAIHRDPFSNLLAFRENMVCEKASIGGSDAHTVEMVGNGYTTFSGITGEEFKRSILRKETFFGGQTTSLAACIRWSRDAAMEICKASYRSLSGKDVHKDVIHARVDRIKKRNKILGIFGSAFYLVPPIPIITGVIGEIMIRKKARRIWDKNKSTGIEPIKREIIEEKKDTDTTANIWK